jgi:rubrerythrin
MCCLIPILFLGAAFWFVYKAAKTKEQQMEQSRIAQAAMPPQQQAHVIYKEKETIREVVKVPCKYCGTLVDVTSPKCPSCGAPQNR